METNPRRPIVGIDIGKNAIHISSPQPDQPPKQWPVTIIKMTDPEWWQQLLAIIQPGSIVAAEPTGWHYLAPVANLLEEYATAEIWLINNTATARTRGQFSAAKTDAMDSRALAVIASQIAEGQAPRGCHLHTQAIENAVLELRMYVNQHVRLKKETTRYKNQLKVFSHSLWPAFSHSHRTWLRCVRLGAVTPRQIIELSHNPPDNADGRTMRHIHSLAASLPNFDGNPFIIEELQAIAADLEATDAEIAENEEQIGQLIVLEPFREITRRWSTVPSASIVAIGALHVATHAQADEMTPDQFKAACGVSPISRESGDQDKTKIIKKGYRPALNALWTWAMQLVAGQNAPNPIHKYYNEGEGHTFYATRAKLARLLSGVARSPDGYDTTLIPNYQITTSRPIPSNKEVIE